MSEVDLRLNESDQQLGEDLRVRDVLVHHHNALGHSCLQQIKLQSHNTIIIQFPVHRNSNPIFQHYSHSILIHAMSPQLKTVKLTVDKENKLLLPV